MTNTAAAEKPAEKTMREVQPPTLKLDQFAVYGTHYERMTATIAAGIAFEDVMRPIFWSNVVHFFRKNAVTGGGDRAGSIIEIRTEDHAYYAEVYVRAVLAGGLVVACVGPVNDPKTGRACPIDLSTDLPWGGDKEIGSDQFAAKWNPGKRGFDIVRKSDQQIVADGAQFRTKEQAQDWIDKVSKAA